MHELPIIQGLWIGNKLSLIEQLSISSFLKNGHVLHLYKYNEISDVPKGTIYKDAEEIMPWKEFQQYQRMGIYLEGITNLFRYKLLHKKGNIWADLDMICIRPIDINHEYIFPRQCEGIVNNCFLKSPVGSPFFKSCYEKAKERMEHKEEIEWGETGPKLITKQIYECNLQNYILPEKYLCPIHWTDPFRILKPKYKKELISEITKDAYAVHLWGKMLNRRSYRSRWQRIKWLIKTKQFSDIFYYLTFNKNKRVSTKSFLGFLQEKYLSE